MAAYWIAHVTVTDPDRYKGYQALAPAAFARFGARFLARGGTAETLEGPVHPRHVVIEFPNRETAEAWYASAAYQAIVKHRTDNATGSLVLVDGYAP